MDDYHQPSKPLFALFTTKTSHFYIEFAKGTRSVRWGRRGGRVFIGFGARTWEGGCIDHLLYPLSHVCMFQKQCCGRIYVFNEDSTMQGHAVAEGVSRRLLAPQAPFCFQVSPYRLYGGQEHWYRLFSECLGFTLSLSFLQCSILIFRQSSADVYRLSI